MLVQNNSSGTTPFHTSIPAGHAAALRLGGDFQRPTQLTRVLRLQLKSASTQADGLGSGAGCRQDTQPLQASEASQRPPASFHICAARGLRLAQCL